MGKSGIQAFVGGIHKNIAAGLYFCIYAVGFAQGDGSGARSADFLYGYAVVFQIGKQHAQILLNVV